jgi:hypothetical protein
VIVPATVTDDSPLRVQLDGADSDSAATVVGFSTPSFAVSDRVWVEIHAGRVFVVGAFTPAGGDVAAHLADTSDAHDASAVSFSPAGGVAATDVQAAIVELDTEKSATSHAHTTGFPNARAVKSAAQSISNTTTTTVQFDNADTFDTDSIHDPASNNTRMTVPAGHGGKWLVLVDVTFAANTAGVREVGLRKNGSSFGKVINVPASSVSKPLTVSFGDLLSLSAGDYIEVTVWQDSGGALNVNGNAAGNTGATTVSFVRLPVAA